MDSEEPWRGSWDIKPNRTKAVRRKGSKCYDTGLQDAGSPLNQQTLGGASIYKEYIHTSGIYSTVTILIPEGRIFFKGIYFNLVIFFPSLDKIQKQVCLPSSSEMHLKPTRTFGKRMKSLCSLLDTFQNFRQHTAWVDSESYKG